MENSALLGVIAVGTVVIVGIAATGFVVFSRFLGREKERAERYRAIHLNLPENDDRP